jgi:hypothetical protein
MKSTTSSRKRGLLLTQQAAQRVDNLIAEFNKEVKRERENRVNVGLLAGSQDLSYQIFFDRFFAAATVSTFFWAAGQLSGIYQVPLVGALDEAVAVALQEQLRARLKGFETEAKMLAQASESSFSELVPRLVLSPSNMNLLRKAVDFAAAYSAQHGIYLASQPHFERKRVVATIDDRTTVLCRDRMDGQVKPWDKPFVDPVTGSEWMHPPFVGGKLTPSEVVHSCRSGSVPD